MKKTGLMEIAFTNGVVMADAKTGLVDLKTLEVVGNLYNGVKSESERGYKRLRDWLELKSTQEFIEVCEEKSSKLDSSLGENAPVLVRSGRGRHSKSWASIHIAIDFAMWLNPEFKYEVIDTFVNKRILDFRRYGIDNHKELNFLLTTIDGYNEWTIVNTSKMINKKTKGAFKKGWDEKEDSAEFQQERDNIQKEIVMLIKKGYIKCWKDLKEYFDK